MSRGLSFLKEQAWTFEMPKMPFRVSGVQTLDETTTRHSTSQAPNLTPELCLRRDPPAKGGLSADSFAGSSASTQRRRILYWAS